MQILHLYISSTPVEKFILDLYTTLSLSLYIERARTMCNVIILKRIHAPNANIQLERHTRNKKKWKKVKNTKKDIHISVQSNSDGGGAAKFSQIYVCFFVCSSVCRLFPCITFLLLLFMQNMNIECRVCLSDFSSFYFAWVFHVLNIHSLHL